MTAPAATPQPAPAQPRLRGPVLAGAIVAAGVILGSSAGARAQNARATAWQAARSVQDASAKQRTPYAQLVLPPVATLRTRGASELAAVTGQPHRFTVATTFTDCTVTVTFDPRGIGSQPTIGDCD